MIATIRPVPMPLMPNIKEEPDHMEHMGVTFGVYESTDYCVTLESVLT